MFEIYVKENNIMVASSITGRNHHIFGTKQKTESGAVVPKS